MLAVLVNRTWAIKVLLIVSIKIALSAWLLYIVDEVFWSVVTWLCSP